MVFLPSKLKLHFNMNLERKKIQCIVVYQYLSHLPPQREGLIFIKHPSPGLIHIQFHEEFDKARVLSLIARHLISNSRSQLVSHG
jgi:hypothetical protein